MRGTDGKFIGDRAFLAIVKHGGKKWSSTARIRSIKRDAQNMPGGQLDELALRHRPQQCLLPA